MLESYIIYQIVKSYFYKRNYTYRMGNCQPITPLSTCTRVLNGRRYFSETESQERVDNGEMNSIKAFANPGALRRESSRDGMRRRRFNIVCVPRVLVGVK